MRILLVEDDTNLGEQVVELLSEQGHEVEHASNGPQALRALDSFVPDAVVIDYRLPVFNGNEIADDIRRHCAPRPRLVAFTSWIDRIDPSLFDASVAKTVDVGEMSRALSRALVARSRAGSEDTRP
jgi:DNA-binding response OmpR family regulator